MTYTGVYKNRGIELNGLVYSGTSIRGTFDYHDLLDLNLALHETNVHDLRFGPIIGNSIKGTFSPEGEKFRVGIYVPIAKLEEVSYPGAADPNLTLIDAFEGLEREIQGIEKEKRQTVKVGVDPVTYDWNYGEE